MLSQESAIFRLAVGEHITGSLDREIKRSQFKKENQFMNDLFIEKPID